MISPMFHVALVVCWNAWNRLNTIFHVPECRFGVTKSKCMAHASICMTRSSFCMTIPRPGMTLKYIL